MENLKPTTACDLNPTIGQKLSLNGREEKAQWKDTLCIGHKKHHVCDGRDPTRPCMCHRGH